MEYYNIFIVVDGEEKKIKQRDSINAEEAADLMENLSAYKYCTFVLDDESHIAIPASKMQYVHFVARKEK